MKKRVLKTNKWCTGTCYA